MCYTPEASLVSFGANVIGCVVLYRYSPSLAAFLLFVSLMQLYDYIFWANQKKNTANYVVTRIAMITNHLQPLVFAAAIMWLDGARTLGPMSRWIVPIYAIAAVAYTIAAWTHIDYTLVTPVSRGSLFWSWNYQSFNWAFYGLFLVALCVLAYEHYVVPLNYIVVAILVLSFAFASIYFKGWTSGRFWCWTVGFMPLVVVVAILVMTRVKT